jgi:crotonobetaine/carnitine-CoA ligase
MAPPTESPGHGPGERTIPGVLLAHAVRRPHEVCCGLDDVRWTWSKMAAVSSAVAGGVASLAGVKAGDRVAVLAPNRSEILELFFGLAMAGAVQVPLNAYLKGAFLTHQLRNSGAEVLVADRAGVEAVLSSPGAGDGLRTIMVLDEERPLAAAELVRYADVRRHAPAAPADVAEADPVSIMYTSGTTGLPKGCVLPHGYYLRCGEIAASCYGLHHGDVVYTALPLFHAGAQLLALMAGVVAGAPAVIDAVFSGRRFLARAGEVGATTVLGVGAMAQAILDTPEDPAADRAHSVRTMLVAPMSPEVQERFRARFGIDPYTEFYGQTECVPIMCSDPAGPRDRASCGRPAPDLEVALLDDHGRELATGEVGEICARPRSRHPTYSTFAGYWDGTAAAGGPSADRWLRTGDLARRRPSGAFEFVDRKTDSLRRRGENVSSVEVERAILEHAAVAAVAVHAVRSDRTEDDIKACIVPAAGIEALSPADLAAFFRGALPYYAIPRYVEVVDRLPENAVGRVMKHILRARPLTESTWDLDALGLLPTRAERRGAPAKPR